jgi:hypothetical protein
MLESSTPGHCTGWRAALASAFSPTSYAPSVVDGTVLVRQSQHENRKVVDIAIELANRASRKR